MYKIIEFPYKSNYSNHSSSIQEYFLIIVHITISVVIYKWFCLPQF